MFLFYKKMEDWENIYYDIDLIVDSEKKYIIDTIEKYLETAGITPIYKSETANIIITKKTKDIIKELSLSGETQECVLKRLIENYIQVHK